jgi:threonine synthase
VVSDQEIMDAKAHIDGCGIGCEPASAASVAGIQKLISKGEIKPNEDVVAVLTGHLLKDPTSVIAYHEGSLVHIHSPYANKPQLIPSDFAVFATQIHLAVGTSEEK